MDNFLIVLEVVLIAMLLLIIFVPVILLFTNWDSVSNFFSLYLQKKLSGVTSETNKDSSQPKAQKQSEIIQKEKPVEEKITLINEENESVEIQKKKNFNLVSKTINLNKNIETNFF